MKPYYSLNDYCKETYGEKIYKIALNAGLTCPNRDGTLDTRGCIFCSAGGSGDFAVNMADYSSVTDQLAAGVRLFRGKEIGSRYITYFQAYTNTYGPIDYLRHIYEEALSMTPSLASQLPPDRIAYPKSVDSISRYQGKIS